ncbi:MAG: GGDEF domain-containing protein [Verrucomicrobia bacterium]|nr:GGDEF domain-containing protein [Verrucomicrobiota bacterium]
MSAGNSSVDPVGATGGTWRAVRTVVVRYGASFLDLAFLAAILILFGHLAWAFDIYHPERVGAPAKHSLNVQELLTLLAILAAGLFTFWIRRCQQEHEINRRVEAERCARELAFKDPLTGLSNRCHFYHALNTALAVAQGANTVHAVLLIEVDGLKEIGLTEGSTAGNAVFAAVAQRLRRAVRTGDLVARLDGNEFVILALHLHGAKAAASVACRIIEAVQEPIVAGNATHQLGTGIGLSLLPFAGNTVAEVLQRAGMALSRAKAGGHVTPRFFEEEIERHLQEREAMERGRQATLNG